MRAHSKPMLYLSCLIFITPLFSGCGSRVLLIKNSADDFNALKNGKVAVAFFAPDKRLEYAEQISLVLGYSMKESYHVYEGIWDPMTVLKDKVLNEAKTKYHITPISLNEIMQPEAFSAMSQRHERLYVLNRVQRRSDGISSSWELEHAIGPPNQFLNTKLSGELINQLKGLNIDYFLEIYPSGA